MTVSGEKIAADLTDLTSRCNHEADESQSLDPLREISYVMNEESTESGRLFTILIERNSGGSPESDYIIQDEISINLGLDGELRVCFTEEMIEQEPLFAEEADQKTWDALLEEITTFCRKHLPKPFPDFDP